MVLSRREWMSMGLEPVDRRMFDRLLFKLVRARERGVYAWVIDPEEEHRIRGWCEGKELADPIMVAAGMMESRYNRTNAIRVLGLSPRLAEFVVTAVDGPRDIESHDPIRMGIVRALEPIVLEQLPSP